jgi:hypothetical protein
MSQKNPEQEGFASLWTGMLNAEVGAVRARQEEKYVNSLVGKPMNRKQRRADLKQANRKKGRK